jgi:hypothetical protein
MSRLVVRAAVTVMLVSTATWMVSGPTVTATVLPTWAKRIAVELLPLSLRLQGRTFGAPGLAAPAVNSEDGRGQPRWNERPGVTRRKRLGFTRGLAVAGRQLSPRPSDASPTARRLPRLASPVTGRLPLRPHRCFPSRCAGRAYGAPLTSETCQPSGPDGKGQAEGQAPRARGGPQWRVRHSIRENGPVAA